MTDIAEEAHMALPAVYRYFPNKHAVMRELALQTFAYDSEILLAGDAPPTPRRWRSPPPASRSIGNATVPSPFGCSCAAIRADAELNALDLAESRRNAATIAATLARATGRTDVAVMDRQALLVVELTDSLISLASRVPLDEADALIREFVNMTACGLASPTQPPP